MDFVFFGVIDIILVVLFIATLIIGFKKGFLEKFVKLANVLCGLLIAIIFCKDVASYLQTSNAFSIYSSIFSKIEENVSGLEIFKNGNITGEGVLKEMGLPQTLASLFHNVELLNTTDAIFDITTALTKVAMIFVSFLILFIGFSILCMILKILIKLLRKATLIRICDGILGTIFYGIIFIIVVYVVMYVLSILIAMPSFESLKNFLVIDMQLESDKFRLSKALYNNNLVTNLFKAFF